MLPLAAAVLAVVAPALCVQLVAVAAVLGDVLHVVVHAECVLILAVTHDVFLLILAAADDFAAAVFADYPRYPDVHHCDFSEQTVLPGLRMTSPS